MLPACRGQREILALLVQWYMYVIVLFWIASTITRLGNLPMQKRVRTIWYASVLCLLLRPPICFLGPQPEVRNRPLSDNVYIVVLSSSPHGGHTPQIAYTETPPVAFLWRYPFETGIGIQPGYHWPTPFRLPVSRIVPKSRGV